MIKLYLTPMNEDFIYNISFMITERIAAVFCVKIIAASYLKLSINWHRTTVVEHCCLFAISTIPVSHKTQVSLLVQQSFDQTLTVSTANLAVHVVMGLKPIMVIWSLSFICDLLKRRSHVKKRYDRGYAILLLCSSYSRVSNTWVSNMCERFSNK